VVCSMAVVSLKKRGSSAMTTLTEFLSTADADSTNALGQARAFSEQVLKPIDERMINERTGE